MRASTEETASRAFANDPEVLLMGEPLGALDAQTRLILMDELLRLWEADRKAVALLALREPRGLMALRVARGTALIVVSTAEFLAA